MKSSGKILIFPFLICGVFVSSIFGQTEEKPPEYTEVSVTENIYLIRVKDQPNYDNIVALTGKDGVLLVDNGFMNTEKSLRQTLRSISSAPVKFIINTHYHHAGANPAFAKEATIIAHKNVRNRLKIPVKMYGLIPLAASEEFALPKITFDDELTIHFNGEEIRIVHFPNVHTDGDSVVFFKKANVVATGDFFVPLLGVCDLPNGCKWSAYVAGIKQLLQVIPKDAKIIPGHHKISTYKDLQNVSEMLEEVTELVRKQIKEGRTLEQIKANGLPERWRPWAEGGINSDFFLTNVYEGNKDQ